MVQVFACPLSVPSSSATRLPAPTICAIRYSRVTTMLALPAAARTGRWRIRSARTSARVYRPALRTSSATSISTTSQATRKPML